MKRRRCTKSALNTSLVQLTIVSSAVPFANCFSLPTTQTHHPSTKHIIQTTAIRGWVQDNDGEWQWEEDASFTAAAIATQTIAATATPTLPTGSFRPKQSLGQNFLRDGNTVAKIVRAFVADATETLSRRIGGDDDHHRHHIAEAEVQQRPLRAIELGPGAGALTDVLVPTIGVSNLQCIEIDGRSIELLSAKHPK